MTCQVEVFFVALELVSQLNRLSSACQPRVLAPESFAGTTRLTGASTLRAKMREVLAVQESD